MTAPPDTMYRVNVKDPKAVAEPAGEKQGRKNKKSEDRHKTFWN